MRRQFGGSAWAREGGENTAWAPGAGGLDTRVDNARVDNSRVGNARINNARHNTAWARRALAALAALGAAAAVQAHDTWFEPLAAGPGAAPGGLLLLGTGNRFPVRETAVDPAFFAGQGCATAGSTESAAAAASVQGQGRATVDVPLQMRGYTPDATRLLAPPGARSCWVQLQPLPIEIDDDKVALYLREIQAGPALRQRWAELQARGVRWVERYSKHARIDFTPAGASPVPMAMDLVWEHAGDDGHRFVVLRDGQPLAGLPLELQSARAALGIWRRSDAQGRITLPALPAGRWLLRGTDLRPAPDQPDAWDSRFVTLAFETGRPAAAPPR